MWIKSWVAALIITLMARGTHSAITANPFAKKLYDDLLSNYNRLIRPVSNNTDKLTVKLGLKLSQLMEVDLKNQVMTTNVWVEQKWHDFKLTWNPDDYGGVEMLYVPSQHIWLPDIVLFNNADGKYEVTLMTKATLSHTGDVVWKPPAIYKSSCKINVEWFPFDEQNCEMKFGSWTYDGYQLDLKHVDQEKGSNVVKIGIDLKEFYHSVEWDILEVPATRNEEYYVPQSSNVANGIEEDDEGYNEEEEEDREHKGTLLTDITFYLTLRRKTLFYTVNLIIPCVGISFLTVLVFYLPSDSGEKVTLCISILLSLTVFFLLLAEIIPPTSIAVPLLGKYLLFTMILVTLSICVTVGVLNIHFRSPATHNMAPWVRRVFIDTMPKFLFMVRPNYVPRYSADFSDIKPCSVTPEPTLNGLTIRPNGYLGADKWQEDFDENSSIKDDCTSHCHHHPHLNQYSSGSRSSSCAPLNHGHHGLGAPDGALPPEPTTMMTEPLLGLMPPPLLCHHGGIGGGCGDVTIRRRKPVHSAVTRALQGVEFIAQHIKKTDKDIEVIEDWKFIAMVLDRLFLWLFTIACISGTGGIIFMAPSLYDMREPIDQKLSEIPKYIAGKQQPF